MAARRYGCQLVVTLLVVALGKIAVLPLSSCNRSSLATQLKGACKNDFKADWDGMRVLGTYANVGVLAPSSPPTWTYSDYFSKADRSHNAYSGTIESSNVSVIYLVEGHKLYDPSEAAAEEPMKVDNTTIRGIKDGIVGQTVALEYIDNTKALYVKIYHPVESGDQEVKYIYSPFTSYYRITCNIESGRIYDDALYEIIFSYVDIMLKRSNCMYHGLMNKNNDPYAPKRSEFIRNVLKDACDIDKNTLKEKKPLFDCVKALNSIPRVLGQSYSEMLVSLEGDRYHDPYTYTCPDRSIYMGDYEKSGKYIWLKEYYPDAFHPMISYRVATYKLDIDRKELHVRVHRTEARSITILDDSFPSWRMREDEKDTVIKLANCDSSPVIEEIARIGSQEAKYLEYDFIGRRYKHPNSTKEMLIEYDETLYRNRRFEFARDWHDKCGAKYGTFLAQGG